MAKIAVVFLLFALFAVCWAEEAKTEEKQPEPLGAQLQKIFQEANEFIKKNVNQDALKDLVNKMEEHGREFVEKAQADFKKIQTK